MTKKRDKIYEGSSKSLYLSEDEYSLILSFNDKLSQSSNKEINAAGKGSINNTISVYLMQQLEMIGVENHLIKKINMHQQLIQQVDVYPIQVYVNNIAHGRYVSEFGMEEGFVFDSPIIDYRIKNKKLNYPAINESQILSFDWMTPDEIKDMNLKAGRVYDFLSGLFVSIGIRLVSVKLEFGRVFNGESFSSMLIDEISPDTCVLWDIETNKKLCFEVASEDIKQIIPVYKEVMKRLNI